MVLAPSEAKTYYDRFGRKLDAQGFYEDPALDDLIVHARFHEAQKVFEFGCGTGRFAARLFAGYLPLSATYLGCDISPTMTALAMQRLVVYGDRASVIQTGGAVFFPLPDNSVDRVVCTYVLDLLSEEDSKLFFSEAFRVLVPGGKLCLTCLSEGVTLPSRLVSLLWTVVFRIRPSLVGGCRPVRLQSYVSPEYWRLAYRNVLTPYGVPSEVLVLGSITTPD